MSGGRVDDKRRRSSVVLDGLNSFDGVCLPTTTSEEEASSFEADMPKYTSPVHVDRWLGPNATPSVTELLADPSASAQRLVESSCDERPGAQTV
jgi:hypothetical protein